MNEQKRTVLFVDDEVEILNSIRRQLRKNEFSVICTDSGNKAFGILKENNIQIIITDENISLINKLELNETTLEISPDVLNMIPQPIIAVSEDGCAALLNNEAMNFFNNTIKPGVRIDEILPEPTASQIMSGLDLPGGQTSFEIEYQDELIRVFTKSLKRQSDYKGFIFFENHCT